MKRLVTVIALLFVLLPSTASAAIAYDNSSISASLNIIDGRSFTTSGSDRFLIVWYYGCGSGVAIDPAGITYGGQAMTKRVTQSDGSARNLTVWTLSNAPSGSNTFSVTGSADCDGSSGVAPVAFAIGSWNGVNAYDASDASAGTGSSRTTTVTTVANNSWSAVGSFTRSGGTYTASTNVTQRFNGDSFIGDSNGPITPAGPFSQTVSFSSSGLHAQASVSMSPAADPAPAATASITGLVRATWLY